MNNKWFHWEMALIAVWVLGSMFAIGKANSRIGESEQFIQEMVQELAEHRQFANEQTARLFELKERLDAIEPIVEVMDGVKHRHIIRGRQFPAVSAGQELGSVPVEVEAAEELPAPEADE